MRLRFMPESEWDREAWLLRSSFILDKYTDAHEATLKAFGLTRPIELGTIRKFLSDHARRSGEDVHKLHVVGVPMPDGAVSTWLALPEIVALKEKAEEIAEDLDCAPGHVVAFLLTGKAFMLPWIDVEVLWYDLGPAFRLHVGSADVTAEEVRGAYVTAVRSALGGESKRPLPAHIYPLVHMEVEGRLAGKTWAERWKAWNAYARHWAITTGHARDRGPGDEKTGYKTLRSYRNYINQKKAQHEWIRRALDRADAERAFRAAQEEDWHEWIRRVGCPTDPEQAFRAAEEGE